MKKHIMLTLLSMLLITGTIVPTVLADANLTDVRYTGTGKYSIVASGVGLEEFNNEITINVPGTVIKAYLYWAGYDDESGDETAVFEIQGIFTQLTADGTYGPDMWKDWENNNHYVYFDDVTNLISSGINEFNITGIEMYRTYGTGVIVVYENSSLPMAEVTILDGLDSFYFEFQDDRGPNSEVTSIEFDATNCQRTIEMTLLVAGTENEDRPNEIWTATGSGVIPENIIGEDPSGVEGYPLYASDGRSWDTYTKEVTVEANDTWLGVQIESIPSQRNPDTSDNEGLGDSGVLAAAGFVLTTPECGHTECGKVTGGGKISVEGGKATFGFNAMPSRDSGTKGELQYLDHPRDLLIHAHIVDSLEVWEELIGNKPWPLRKARSTGPCTVNHENGYRFEVYVEDNGEPGKADYFSIKIFNSNGEIIYESSGQLIAGNVQIHKCNEKQMPPSDNNVQTMKVNNNKNAK